MSDDKKVFFLDTNVLIQDPEAIDKFGSSDVVLHICVIKELDKLKHDHDRNTQSKARHASRKLDEYRSAGPLQKGVEKQGGGRFFIDVQPIDFADCTVEMEKSNDNTIILAADRWQAANGRPVVLKSNDTNVRIMANAIGLESEAYTFQKVTSETDNSFTGITTLILEEKNGHDIFRELHVNGNVSETLVYENMAVKPVTLYPNHCCRLQRKTSETILAVYKKNYGLFRQVPKPPQKGSRRGIQPLNDEQAFAYHLLSDPEIRVVTLDGATGSGKTLLPLLAAFEQLDARYEKIVVYRPTFELGKDLGYLPGNLSEKYEPWTVPIYENFDLVLSERQDNPASVQPRPRKPGKSHDEKEDRPTTTLDFIAGGKLRLAPINFEQGCTIRKSFVLVDEVQNLDHSDTKALGTRMGEGTKIVLVGDVRQIVNPYCHATSNGLWDTIEAFKGHDVYAHVTLCKTERDPLAKLFDELL